MTDVLFYELLHGPAVAGKHKWFFMCKQASRKLGFPVLYGDGSRPAVLQSAGISSPKAVMVMYTGKERTIEAVQRIRLAFPAVIILVTAHLLDYAAVTILLCFLMLMPFGLYDLQHCR